MNKQLRPLIKKIQSMPSLFFDAGFWSAIAAWGGGLVAATAIWALILANRESDRKDRELAAFQQQAQKDISAADSRAAEARAAAEESKSVGAKANERAAILEKEAAVAKLEQEKLKAQLAWRAIPGADADKMIPILATTPSSVVLAYTANDPEALSLAIQLSNIFAKAGWETMAQSRTYNDQLFTGLFVNGSGREAEAVRTAFNSVGAGFSNDAVPAPPYAMNVRIPAPPVLIMIGCKQPPF